MSPTPLGELLLLVLAWGSGYYFLRYDAGSPAWVKVVAALLVAITTVVGIGLFLLE